MCTLWDQVHRNCALYGMRYIENVHSMGSHIVYGDILKQYITRS